MHDTSNQSLCFLFGFDTAENYNTLKLLSALVILEVNIAGFFNFCLMSGHYRRVHGLECLMGNKCKMEKNSTVCVEVQNDKKYS